MLATPLHLRPVGSVLPESAPLRERIKTGGKTQYTEHYVLYRGNEEVGFLAVDLFPPPQPCILYEVFVLPTARNCGIGSHLVAAAEGMARNVGYKQIRLHAKTLDPENTPQDWLEQWYIHRGYQSCDEPGWFEKQIASQAAHR